MRHLWVDEPEALADLAEELAGQPAYGIDTEFHRERTYYPHLALLQLSWPGGVALVDPLALDVAPLGRVLAGPGVAVAHAAAQDLEVLGRACGVVPSRLFDTQVAAGLLGLSTPSLAVLLRSVLGRPLPKADRLSDWTRRPLTAEQRDYAAADVAHLLDLLEEMESRLAAQGRLAWAEQECELVRRVALAERDGETAWWRIKEARRLRDSAAAVAQVVAAWRERTAAALDRPVRTLLPDMALVGIAQRPPRSREQLRGVRGLKARHLGGGRSDSILAAVEEGLALPPERVRLPPDDQPEPRWRAPLALAGAWLAQHASDVGLDPGLLATRADLVALMRGDSSSRLASGWRAEVAGEGLRRLLDGEVAVAFDRRGRLVLEERSGRPA